MPPYRALVATHKPADLAADFIVNTLYFDSTGIVDPGAFTQELATLFATYRPLPTGYTRTTVKLYDMADGLPRPVIATRTGTALGNAGAPGPREVALCLSYYSNVNQKRFRGRMFLGPWAQPEMSERPAISAGNPAAELSDLFAGLLAAGGPGFEWMLYSPTDLAYKVVTDGWYDNEWDTVRSRGLKATSRTVVT